MACPPMWLRSLHRPYNTELRYQDGCKIQTCHSQSQCIKQSAKMSQSDIMYQTVSQNVTVRFNVSNSQPKCHSQIQCIKQLAKMSQSDSMYQTVRQNVTVRFNVSNS